jgi:predicted TIM-barrel fold metal-dependent hydrolase
MMRQWLANQPFKKTGPAMQKVIDSHHHIWRKKDLPWLNEGQPRIFGDYTALKRDYSIDEFKADTAPCNVVKSVYVQANWGHDRAVDEARWVDETGRMDGMPNGMVAFADLNSSEVERMLDAYMGIPIVKGVRQHLHWHKNPDFSYVPVPDMFDQKQWRSGLTKVGERGLSFDLQVFPGQMVGAAAMVADFPNISFILNHGGMLDNREPQNVELWRNGMAALAKQPNVYVKLTGLGTFDHKATLALVEPIVRTSLELFGPKRLVYGSNFPIEKLWTTYQGYFNNIWQALGDASETDRDDIFYGNAERVYRLA